MRAARLALAVGLLALVGVLVLVLSGSPATLTGTNGIEADRLAGLGARQWKRLSGERSAARARLGDPPSHSKRRRARASPLPSARVGRSSRTARARRDGLPRWSRSRSRPWLERCATRRSASRSPARTNVCRLWGVPTSRRNAASIGASVLPGRIAIEYVRPGASSWWSLISPSGPADGARPGMGRDLVAAVAVASLMAAAIALGSWRTIRDSR